MSSAQDFTNADGHGYILGRSHQAACRLNLQHYLWKEALGFTVEPTVDIPAHAQIADVACGTGLWMVDTAELHPDADILGFDLDLTQAPNKYWLPANVALDTWDVRNDIDPFWEGRFDFVHVRLLVLVLSGENVKAFISNLFKMLKPGGYLQWDELDSVNMHVRKIDPGLASPALDEIRTLCYSEGRHDWTLNIPDMLEEGDFEQVNMTHFGDSPSLARAFNDQHMLTMDEFAAGMVREGKPEVARRVSNLVAKAYGEAVQGAYLCIPRVVVVARKPL